MIFAKALGLGLMATLLAFGSAEAQTAYKTEYKVSTVLGAPFPWGLSAERWAQLVKERTNGRINLKVYPGAQLVGGDQTKEFTAMRQGVIDMAVGSTINWSPQVAELNLFSLPFLMPDHKAIDAITGSEVGKKLFDIIASKDVVPLAWGENGFRELTNSKRAVKTPEDLKGLKIRVVGSPPVMASIALWSGMRKGRENRFSSATWGDQLMVEPSAMSITPWRMAVNSLVWSPPTSWLPG